MEPKPGKMEIEGDNFGLVVRIFLRLFHFFSDFSGNRQYCRFEKLSKFYADKYA
jgi:hypothetical protein